MSKSTRTLPMLMTLGVLLLGCWGSACRDQTEAARCSKRAAFVKANGPAFELCGEPFRFAGSNNYYLVYKSRAAVDDVLEQAVAMNLRVIRIWGFLDGPSDHGVALQPALGVYDEAGFARLDYVVARAGELGLRLVVPLVNHWDDFGGMNQYVRWLQPGGTRDDFYRNEAIRDAYRAYVAHVVRRINSITGVAYADDPTIMTWELTNEARMPSDPTGETLLAWTDAMSTFVRGLDPNHLIALGDEGMMRRPSAPAPYDGAQGVDWERIIELPNIDYGTVHLYSHFFARTGDGVGFEEKSGTEWILEHQRVADAVGKPVVLEEYGIKRDANLDRALIYRAWNDAVLDHGGDGVMFWLLTGIDDSGGGSGELYPDYDGHRITHPSALSELLAEYAARMNGQDLERAPRAAFYAPVEGELVRREGPVRVKVFDYGRSLTSLSVSTRAAAPHVAVADEDGDGYFTGWWDASAEPGAMVFEALAEFQDGARSQTSVTVQRAAMAAPIRPFNFTEGLEGWRADGVYQARFGTPEVEHAPEVGGGALRVNVELSGTQAWEEVRVLRGDLLDLAGVTGVRFDLLFPEALLPASGQLNPYLVFDPGWVKVGVDGPRHAISALEAVEEGGVRYRRLALDIDVPPGVDLRGVNTLHLGLVGSGLAYQGPIYVDNVALRSAP